MVWRGVVWLAAAVSLFAAVSTAEAAPPTTGTFAGSLGVSLPKGAMAELRAVSRETGAVVDAGKASRSGAFALKLPAGAYQVVASVTSAHSQPVVLSAGLTLKPGQRRTKANIRKARRKKRSAKKRATSSYVQEGGQVTAGSVAVGIHGFTGPSSGDASYLAKGLPGLLTVDVVDGNRCGLTVVEVERRADILKELDFQQSQYVDPSTRVTRNLIEEQVAVHGSVGKENSSGKVPVTLRLVESATGKGLGDLSATLDLNDAEKSLAALGRQLTGELCKLRDTFEVTLDLDATVDTATYAGRGAIHQTITAKLTGPNTHTFTGAGMLVWSDLAVTASKMQGCTVGSPVTQTRPWDVTIEAPPGTGQLQVTWAGKDVLLATSTISCPSTGLVVGGGPFLTLFDAAPLSFSVPATKEAEQAVSWNAAGTTGSGTLKLKYPAGIVRDG